LHTVRKPLPKRRPLANENVATLQSLSAGLFGDRKDIWLVLAVNGVSKF